MEKEAKSKGLVAHGNKGDSPASENSAFASVPGDTTGKENTTEIPKTPGVLLYTASHQPGLPAVYYPGEQSFLPAGKAPGQTPEEDRDLSGSANRTPSVQQGIQNTQPQPDGSTPGHTPSPYAQLKTWGSSAVERTTGAPPFQWVERAKEYVQNSQRRAAMNERLRRLVLHSVQKQPEQEDLALSRYINRPDVSGLHIHGYKVENKDEEKRGNEPIQTAKLLLMPEGTLIREHAFPGGSPQSGDGVCRRLLLQNDSRHHFVTSAPAHDPRHEQFVHGISEFPLLGATRDGTVIKPFVRKNTLDPVANELESGGIVLKNNAIAIVPFSELERNSGQGAVVEQAFFVVSDDSWRLLAQQPSYAPNRDYAPFFVGYFQNGQEKRYFASLCTGYGLGIETMFRVMDETKEEHGFQSWRAACIETGGAFAGILRPDKQKNGVYAVGLTDLGDTGHFYDTGHERFRHYDFSWQTGH